METLVNLTVIALQTTVHQVFAVLAKVPIVNNRLSAYTILSVLIISSVLMEFVPIIPIVGMIINVAMARFAITKHVYLAV